MSQRIGYVTAVMLLGTSWAASAFAQSDKPWDGSYLGVNLGGTENATCANAVLNATATDASGPKFSACPSSGFVGGLQIGENFQAKRLFWGLGAELEIKSGQRSIESLKSAGGPFPSGTYTYSGRLSPSNLIIGINYWFGYWEP